MKFLFVGGSGRSGTSAVAERLRVVPEINSFLDVELRILSELDGIPDLYWTLVEAYSPQRAIEATRRFSAMFLAALDDASGAVGLSRYVSREDWSALLDDYLTAFLACGVPRHQDSSRFFSATAELFGKIALLSGEDRPYSHQYFLEKTPHNLLRLRLLARLPARSYYLHVTRDPRIVAKSLAKMDWGPSSLDAASIWVSEYFSEFFRAWDWASRANVRKRNIWIEAVPADPRGIAQQVFSDLAIDGDDTIFDDITTDTLFATADLMDEAEVDTLNTLLGPLARQLGYDDKCIGLLVDKPDMLKISGAG